MARVYVLQLAGRIVQYSAEESHEEVGRGIFINAAVEPGRQLLGRRILGQNVQRSVNVRGNQCGGHAFAGDICNHDGYAPSERYQIEVVSSHLSGRPEEGGHLETLDFDFSLGQKTGLHLASHLQFSLQQLLFSYLLVALLQFGLEVFINRHKKRHHQTDARSYEHEGQQHPAGQTGHHLELDHEEKEERGGGQSHHEIG